MQYTLSLDAAYAAEWQISDDELMQSHFEVAVEMYDRLFAYRDYHDVLRWMHGHCRIHWGYQLIACLAAFDVWPSLSEVIQYWRLDGGASGLGGFSSCRLEALREEQLPPRVATVNPQAWDYHDRPKWMRHADALPY